MQKKIQALKKRPDAGNLCRVMRLTAGRQYSLREFLLHLRSGCAFLAGSKNARKKIAAVKKRPDAPRCSTEISQTHYRSDMRNFGRFALGSVRAAISSRPERTYFHATKSTDSGRRPVINLKRSQRLPCSDMRNFSRSTSESARAATSSRPKEALFRALEVFS